MNPCTSLLPIIFILFFSVVPANSNNLRELVIDKMYKRHTSSDDPEFPASTSIEVIGVGLGRTGTDSLALALRRMGYQTYSSREAENFWHIDSWNRYFEKEGTTAEEVKLTGLVDKSKENNILFYLENAGYTATVGFPAAAAYKELMQRNPDAKVILSLHPKGARGWAMSTAQTTGRWEAILSLR